MAQTVDTMIVMGNATISAGNYDFIPTYAKVCLIETDASGNKVISQYENNDSCSYVYTNGAFYFYAYDTYVDDTYVRLFLNDDIVHMKRDSDTMYVDSLPVNLDLPVIFSNFPYHHSSNEEMNTFGWIHKAHAYVNDYLSINLNNISLVVDTSIPAYHAQYDSSTITTSTNLFSNEFTILHEYAHFIFKHVYSNPFNTCPSDHYLHADHNIGCAYSEGWADAFYFILNDIDFTNVPSSSGSMTLNIETRSIFSGTKTIDIQSGDGVEFNFAALLYDIYDDNDDVQYGNIDDIDNQFIDIWNLIKNTKPTDHIDMANIWNGDIPYGNYGSTNTKLDNLMKLKSISFKIK